MKKSNIINIVLFNILNLFFTYNAMADDDVMGPTRESFLVESGMMACSGQQTLSIQYVEDSAIARFTDCSGVVRAVALNEKFETGCGVKNYRTTNRLADGKIHEIHIIDPRGASCEEDLPWPCFSLVEEVYSIGRSSVKTSTYLRTRDWVRVRGEGVFCR